MLIFFLIHLQAIRTDVETAEELLSALQAAASEVAATAASRSTLEVDAETQSAVAALNDLTRNLAEAETKMAAAAELRLVATPHFLISKLSQCAYKFVKNSLENETGKSTETQSTKFKI